MRKNTMSDEEIEQAVEAIMSLRPLKPKWEEPVKRVDVKRRFDELTFQRELASIDDALLLSQ
ncbi:hypothetical protein BS049_RS23360 [Vibrio parahaemolyticus]|nr:hypothetical protein [Vibrio parahaemolyticus]